jgi:hypothetical protein
MKVSEGPPGSLKLFLYPSELAYFQRVAPDWFTSHEVYLMEPIPIEEKPAQS